MRSSEDVKICDQNSATHCAVSWCVVDDESIIGERVDWSGLPTEHVGLETEARMKPRDDE